MPKTGRRNLLKLIGMSPVLLVPWKPATEQVVPPPPPPVPAEPEKLTLDEALSRVDWDAMDLPTVPVSTDPNSIDMKPLRYARATSLTASVGFYGAEWED